MIKKTLKNLEIPLIQGGMGIGISMGNLAGAVAAEGGMGVISTANIGFREEDYWQNPLESGIRALKKEIEKAKAISKGRGLLAINAMVVTTGYGEMVKEACKAGIDAIISGAGIPLSLPEHVLGYDVLLAPIVSSAKSAKTICNAWFKRYKRLPDFLVIEGSKAGGHLGFSKSELEEETAKPLDVLIDEVSQITKGYDTEIPLFVAGGILTRKDVGSLIEKGAEGVQIATPFIATKECDATQAYKDVLIRATDDEICITQSPVGMPGRAIKTPLVKKVGEGQRIEPKECVKCINTCNPKETPYCINRALIDAFYGKYDTGLFFTSASGGKINKMSTVAEVIEELVGDRRRK